MAGTWEDWTEGEFVDTPDLQNVQDSLIFIYANDSAANSALTNKTEGTLYFNTTDDKLKAWDGSSWIIVGG